MSVHVFRDGPWQPLTRYKDWIDDTEQRTPERRRFQCHECQDWRTAKNLQVSVAYDRIRLRCADGCYGGLARKRGWK